MKLDDGPHCGQPGISWSSLLVTIPAAVITVMLTFAAVHFRGLILGIVVFLIGAGLATYFQMKIPLTKR